MNKKISTLFVLSLLLIMPLVSAQSFGSINLGEGMRQIIDQVLRFFEPIFSTILSDSPSNEFFFAKILLLILLSVIIHLALVKSSVFEGKENISILISIIVAVLAVRYMSDSELIVGILLPYGALGVALTTTLPFLIFAYVIHVTKMPGIGRKIGWMIYGIAFVILWVEKLDPIHNLSTLANQFYLWTTVAIVGMILMDKKIHGYFRGLDLKKFETDIHESEIANLQVELAELSRSGVTSHEIESRKKKIKKRIDKLGAKYA